MAIIRERELPRRGKLSVLLALLMAAGSIGAGPERLQVEPPSATLSGRDARQQLAVTLRHPDGSLRDVTRACRFDVEPPGLATVSKTGVVRPARPGVGSIRVAIDGKITEVSLTIKDIDRVRLSSFRADVSPLLSKAGCNMGACHGNLSGKGGFKLSLRGEDPAFDYQALTRDQLGRRIDRMAPERSLIFLKPTGALRARGGPAIRPGLDRGRDSHRDGSRRVPSMTPRRWPRSVRSLSYRRPGSSHRESKPSNSSSPRRSRTARRGT